MGIHYSPRTVTDGLVLAFDTGNDKSYKGVPTTNIAPYISTHGTSEFTLPSLPNGVRTVYSKGAVINGTTDWADIMNTSGYSIPAGERLVISAWVYVPADKVNNRFNINADINGSNTGMGSWHDLAAGQWHKLIGSWLNSTGATANATSTRLEPWTPAEWTGGSITTYGINFMVESGPFAVDYQGSQALPANTTRSVSGSLLDLTGNETINISNSSFTNDGLTAFDGTGDYFDLGSDQVIKTSGGWTVESIVKYDAVAGGYNNLTSPANFIGSDSVSYNSWFWSVLNSKLALWNLSPGVWKYGSTTLQANTWYHTALVCSHDGTSYQMYLNGVPEGGDHTTYSWNAAYSGLRIRYFGAGQSTRRYINGTLPITKVYDTPLSAEQVQQNYNAIKGRFGL